jgi:hypothetical protein
VKQHCPYDSKAHLISLLTAKYQKTALLQQDPGDYMSVLLSGRLDYLSAREF